MRQQMDTQTDGYHADCYIPQTYLLRDKKRPDIFLVEKSIHIQCQVLFSV